MDDKIRRQRKPDLRHRARCRELADMTTVKAADSVGIGEFRILETDLHVIERRAGQILQQRFVQQHSGCDEIGVETGSRGGANKLRQILSRCWLATGQVQLQDAQDRRFFQDSSPRGVIQFGVGTMQRDRIGTVRDNAAGSDALGPPPGPSAARPCSQSQRPFISEFLQHGRDISGDHIARRIEAGRQLVDDRTRLRAPSTG
jgi:hypothetical protein